MRLWRREQFDPREGGSAEQRDRSTEIDGQLEAETAELRKRLDILVLGTSKAATRFVEDWERYLIEPSSSQAAASTEGKRLDPTAAWGVQSSCATAGQQDDNGDDGLDRCYVRSADDVAAELAGELRAMSVHAAYESGSQASRSVDLLAASYLIRATRIADGRQYGIVSRIGIEAGSNTIDNIVRNQTSVLHGHRTMPLSQPRGGFECIRFHVLGEQNLAHSKTFSFFLGFSNVAVLIDLNTLHEKHPDGQVTNAIWATHLARSLDLGRGDRLVHYVFTGFGHFRTMSTGRSPADYLATWFDEFVPTADMQRSDDAMHTLRATLNYLLQRVSLQTQHRQHYSAFLDADDPVHFRLFAASFLEIFIPMPIREVHCFGPW